MDDMCVIVGVVNLCVTVGVVNLCVIVGVVHQCVIVAVVNSHVHGCFGKHRFVLMRFGLYVHSQTEFRSLKTDLMKKPFQSGDFLEAQHFVICVHR